MRGSSGLAGNGADREERAGIAGAADAWRLENRFGDGPLREGRGREVLLVIRLLVQEHGNACVNCLPPVILLQSALFPGREKDGNQPSVACSLKPIYHPTALYPLTTEVPA